MTDDPPGVWNWHTLGNPNLTTDPPRTLPLPQSDDIADDALPVCTDKASP